MYTHQCPFYKQNAYAAQDTQYMRNEQPSQMVSPESTMPEYELEGMYPKIYYIIYPHVIHHCDMFDKSCCSMKIPTSEEIRQMADNISMNVEPEVDATIKAEISEADGNVMEARQLGFGSRRLLRDLVGTLLLREFFERRHRPHHHYSHHYMGY
jgi:hypothetical protein